MRPEPLVSFVMPAYNCESHIGAAVSGALSQTYQNTEIIVVNDGSSDRTGQVLAGFGDMIRVIDQPNAGPSAARNTGAAAARGEYIAFADGDDLMLPGYLDRMMDTLQAAGSGRWWVMSQAYFLSADGIDTRRPVVAGGAVPRAHQRMTILQRNIVGPPAAIVHADMHREIGGMDPELGSSEDWDYWARAIFNGWYAVFQPEPLYLYRWSDGSLSNNHAALLQGEDQLMTKLRQGHWASMTSAERAHLERRLQLGSPYRLLELANNALRKADYATATQLFEQAASLMPVDRRLQVKARSMRWMPPTARYWRARRLAADQERRRYDFVPDSALQNTDGEMP